MQRLTSIVATNAEGAIGAGNSLPWRVKSDLRFFRQQTLGHVVIMGRKTYDSLGAPLAGRTNIVVTHGFSLFPSSAECQAVGSIEEAVALASKLSKKKKDVFVVGGASMYVQFAPLVERYLITEISKSVPDADTFLPNSVFGDQDDWTIQTLQSGNANDEGDEADYAIYEFLYRHPADRVMARNRMIDRHFRRAIENRHASGVTSRAAV